MSLVISVKAAQGVEAGSRRHRRAGLLPGFGLSTGYTVLYLGLLVLIPLTTLPLKSPELGWHGFREIVLDPRVVTSYKLSFGTALLAATVNAFFRLIVAWVLVRYTFPGRKIVDALIDLPFALPTAVAGIALTALYARNGWLGAPLESIFGLKEAFTPLGIVIALTFIGTPFGLRSLQPLLESLEQEVEEPAASLGATRLETVWRVVLPGILPSLLTGFALAFARGVGEYGSVVFIAGNMPMISEITPLLILSRLEQYDYAGAAAIATVMLAMSFVLLLIIN